MSLDRKYQRDLLNSLSDAYPKSVSVEKSEQQDVALVKNAWYLEGHGLIECEKGSYVTEGPFVAGMRITEKGLDFISDDGGLSAILGTVTVKLHADTLRELLESKIKASAIPEVEKETLIKTLRGLSADAMKKVATRLIDEAVNRLPDAIPQLQQWLGF